MDAGWNRNIVFQFTGLQGEALKSKIEKHELKAIQAAFQEIQVNASNANFTRFIEVLTGLEQKLAPLAKEAEAIGHGKQAKVTPLQVKIFEMVDEVQSAIAFLKDKRDKDQMKFGFGVANVSGHAEAEQKNRQEERNREFGFGVWMGPARAGSEPPKVGIWTREMAQAQDIKNKPLPEVEYNEQEEVYPEQPQSHYAVVGEVQAAVSGETPEQAETRELTETGAYLGDIVKTAAQSVRASKEEMQGLINNKKYNLDSNEKTHISEMLKRIEGTLANSRSLTYKYCNKLITKAEKDQPDTKFYVIRDSSRQPEKGKPKEYVLYNSKYGEDGRVGQFIIKKEKGEWVQGENPPYNGRSATLTGLISKTFPGLKPLKEKDQIPIDHVVQEDSGSRYASYKPSEAEKKDEVEAASVRKLDKKGAESTLDELTFLFTELSKAWKELRAGSSTPPGALPAEQRVAAFSYSIRSCIRDLRGYVDTVGKVKEKNQQGIRNLLDELEMMQSPERCKYLDINMVIVKGNIEQIKNLMKP